MTRVLGPLSAVVDLAGELIRRPVTLLVETAGGLPGPWWAPDAGVDTAPYGDETA